MQQEEETKWEGKLSVKLQASKANQVWPFLEDFYNIHNWLSSIDTCYSVDDDDTSVKPGSVRYCSSTLTDDSGNQNTSWVKERLLAIDRDCRSLTYEVVDGNMGIKGYVTTMKVIEESSDEKDGCKIEWSFEADPIEVWRIEDLVEYVESTLQGMAEKMDKALSTQKSSDL
ncbi:hypothetical protein ACHQM5_027297 [Ranunculus cassubicifolius]